MKYSEMSKEQLLEEQITLQKEYENICSLGLKLDMSRGKPGSEQLDLTVHMLDIVNSGHSCISNSGVDCRNYGLLDGLPSCKKMFSGMLRVPEDKIFVGGNSSLNMMFDTIHCFMTKPVVEGMKPWLEVENRKWLCPVPGYDRHFGITEYFGFEMIPIPMDENGPDMDIIEDLISKDDSIKGIWCVPKYSNPAGITYSEEVVKRFASLKPLAKDFRIMWDDAYCIHDICKETEHLHNIWDECVKNGTEDMVILFCSTSKITFPGSGVAALAASDQNMKILKKKYSVQTIGYDKINMLRHVLFFG
ncbi:MAG: aminotransferase, partial [Acutalibacteraceae bacterium]